jgi:hypothetical protein
MLSSAIFFHPRVYRRADFLERAELATALDSGQVKTTASADRSRSPGNLSTPLADAMLPPPCVMVTEWFLPNTPTEIVYPVDGAGSLLTCRVTAAGAV